MGRACHLINLSWIFRIQNTKIVAKAMSPDQVLLVLRDPCTACSRSNLGTACKEETGSKKAQNKGRFTWRCEKVLYSCNPLSWWEFRYRWPPGMEQHRRPTCRESPQDSRCQQLEHRRRLRAEFLGPSMPESHSLWEVFGQGQICWRTQSRSIWPCPTFQRRPRSQVLNPDGQRGACDSTG